MAMAFFHVLDDFWMQPVLLGRLKTKSWWKENAPDPSYKYDYIPCLIAHAWSWSFMIHLPIAIYMGFNVGNAFLLSVVINAAIHAVVDNLKANHGRINLIMDQSIHLLQIIITFILMEVM